MSFSCHQARMHRTANSDHQSQTRGRMQVRHNDMPDHGDLLLRSIRGAVRPLTVPPQHHRGLLAEDQDPDRELPDEAEEDRVLQDEVQNNTPLPEERVHHQGVHIQLPREGRGDETEAGVHSGREVRNEEE